MNSIFALEEDSYIGSRFTGPKILREDGKFECVLPEMTEFEELLQRVLLATK